MLPRVKLPNDDAVRRFLGVEPICHSSTVPITSHRDHFADYSEEQIAFGPLTRFQP